MASKINLSNLITPDRLCKNRKSLPCRVRHIICFSVLCPSALHTVAQSLDKILVPPAFQCFVEIAPAFSHSFFSVTQKLFLILCRKPTVFFLGNPFTVKRLSQQDDTAADKILLQSGNLVICTSAGLIPFFEKHLIRNQQFCRDGVTKLLFPADLYTCAVLIIIKGILPEHDMNQFVKQRKQSSIPAVCRINENQRRVGINHGKSPEFVGT